MIAIDEKRGQYLLMGVGWDGALRVRSVVFHAQLKDGKVYIEWDGTSPSMTEELMARGLAREDLVLAFEQEAALPPPVAA